MYFACDHPPPTVVRQILDEVETVRIAQIGTALNVFALIDGAFDEDFLAKAFGKEAQRISLYERTQLGGLKNEAPFLCHIEEPKLNDVWFENLLTHAGNRPMWSIVVTGLDLHTLANHFCPYMIAKTDDGLEWPVRWGDTRVLPSLLEILDPGHIDHLLEPIHSWLAVSRKGGLVGWQGQGKTERTIPAYEKLPIDDARFGMLVDTAEPDAILASVQDTQPELLKPHLPSESHRLISRQLKVANNFHLHQAPIRQHFAVLGLFLREDFAVIPAMSTLLKKVRDGNDYMNEVELLPADFWRLASI